MSVGPETVVIETVFEYVQVFASATVKVYVPGPSVWNEFALVRGPLFIE